MSNIKFPKKLLEACQNGDVSKMQKFFLSDKLGRYNCWSKPIIENFGFELFKTAMLDWKDEFFENKYKKDLLSTVMFLACDGNKECQKYIIDEKIPFNEHTIFSLSHLIDKIQLNNLIENVRSSKDSDFMDFFEQLKTIEHPKNEIFDENSPFFGFIETSFYKKNRAILFKEFFNMQFSQKHKEVFLRWSAINLDWRSCQHWISEGASLMLESLQQENNTKKSLAGVLTNQIKGNYPNGFWVFDARHLRSFSQGRVFAGQDTTFEVLIKACTIEQKSANNLFWEKTATNIIEQFECDQAKHVLRIALENNADFSLKWFKNENEAAKFIEFNFYHGGLQLMKKWINDFPENKNKLVQMVYKQAVLNGESGICEKLVSENFSPEDFINSDAFKNITKNGSMTAHIKNSYILSQVELSRKIVHSFYLSKSLGETLSTETPKTPIRKIKI